MATHAKSAGINMQRKWLIERSEIIRRILKCDSPIAVYIDRNGQLRSSFYTFGFVKQSNDGHIKPIGVYESGMELKAKIDIEKAARNA